MTDQPRLRVLFLRTENSCRSPMAEGLARLLGKGFVDASSAGTSPVPVHPLAVRVMAEVGIDISTHQPQGMDRVLMFLLAHHVLDGSGRAPNAWSTKILAGHLGTRSIDE